MAQVSALIVGGGIGGITAALALAKRGCRATVFEQSTEFQNVGAGIQLSPNCTRVLHHLGLQQALRDCAFVPEGTQFRHWKTGRVIAESRLGDQALGRYGYPYYHVHRRDLMDILRKAASASSLIDWVDGASVTDFSESDTSLDLVVNRKDFSADVLIGADGIHSNVRERLFGSDAPTFTGNVAWRTLVPVERLDAGAVPPVASVWWGPGKHFVHYYVRGGDLVNCVCVVEKNGWETEAWTAKGSVDELQNDFAGWHEDIQHLIENVDADSLYKWALHDRAPLTHWSKGRVSLLGDACHPTLPFMAQGAAMAIEDGAVLADCLAFGSDPAASLAKYGTLRKPRTATVQAASRRNARLFHLSGIGAWLRDRGAAYATDRVMDSLFRYDALSAVER